MPVTTDDDTWHVSPGVSPLSLSGRRVTQPGPRVPALADVS